MLTKLINYSLVPREVRRFFQNDQRFIEIDVDDTLAKK